MALYFRRRRFAPSLFATVLVLVGVGIGVRLGLWQLDRAEEKRDILAHIAEGETTVQPLSTANAETLPRYQRVSARGRYDATHQILLDNMPSSLGRPGFRVLTALELDDGGWILVDRGWVPLGPTRKDLPTIDVDQSERTIVGRLDALPRPGMRMAQQDEAGGAWPRILNFPQQEQLEQALDRKLASRIVLLDPQQSDGYERVWTPREGFGPDRHIAYAVQWFALAATMAIVYLVLGFKPIKRS